MPLSIPSPFQVTHTTDRQNMQLLIQLRWLAVVGQVVTISLVRWGFDIYLPLYEMLAVLAGLVITNLICIWWLRWRQHDISSSDLFVALLADVGALSLQLYLSGGANNPFITLFLLQVTLGAVLLKPFYAWGIVVVTGCCAVALAFFYQPLQIMSHRSGAMHSLYLLGLLISFGLNAILLVSFINRIMSNLQLRDTRLADLRQRAAEEEHIVRMGLLASGAAHELGTPLSTLAVILGDWQRMPSIAQDGELMEDLHEMEHQVQRCKSIVTGVLLSAGETRGDAPETTTLVTFMDRVVAQWQSHRQPGNFVYRKQVARDVPIISDTSLQQMIFNVLDNALEASPDFVQLVVECPAQDDAQLVLQVTDSGPGFKSEILAHLGKPYQSTKQRPGGGLGLFLVMNVARSLGGHVEARNREQHLGGGAAVRISLPLASIALDDEPHHDLHPRTPATPG
ncbi:ATP-binding protein [Comamonas sp.]|uniref:ATP-binding protein n=2 Tax=Comamonas sp. TaxID=34028 RepID=UPI00289F37F7|nr:ATP-binding protein [Comamonas sp.]